MISSINPKIGGRRTPPHTVFFFPLPKISLGNPFLKIFDISKLFVADANMRKKKKLFYFLSEHFGSENRQCMRGLKLIRHF